MAKVSWSSSQGGNILKIGDSITVSATDMTGSRYRLAYVYLVETAIPENPEEVEVTIVDGIRGSWTSSWTLPNDLAYASPDRPAGSSYANLCYLRLYNVGAGNVNESTTYFWFTIPATAPFLPTITSVGITEKNTAVSGVLSHFVQNKSNICFDITASFKYGATLKDCYIYCKDEKGNSWSYRGATYTVTDFPYSGKITANVVCTDSRSLTATREAVFYVYPYNPPSIEVTADRTDTTTTTTINVMIHASVQSLNLSNYISDTEHNTISATLRYKQSTSSTWLTRPLTPSGLVYNNTVALTGLLPAEAYDVKVEVADLFQTVTRQDSVAVLAPALDFLSGGKGVAIGKNATQAGFDVGWPSVFRETVAMNHPLGIASGGTDANNAAAARINLGIVYGTWTPTCTYAQTNSWGYQEGYYVKIGSLVIISFAASFTVRMSSTSAITIDGLPYA